MKAFVATKESQGKRKNDFNFCKEGEFVYFGMECCGESIDGECGCRRDLCGFETLKGTTTFKVIETEITENEYIKKFLESQRKAGWLNKKSEELTVEKFMEEAKIVLDIAKEFPVEKILEKRGNKIQVRK